MDRRTRSHPFPLAFVPHAHAADLWLDVGHVRRPPGFLSHRNHRLGYYQIVLLTSGGGRAEVAGESFGLAPGSVFFAPANEVVRLEMEARTERFVLCVREGFLSGALDPLLLRRLPLFGRAPRGRVLRVEGKERRWLEEQMAAMSEEIQLLDGQSRAILQAQLAETLHRCERFARQREGAFGDPHPTPWIERFLAVLEESYRQTHRVDELAHRMGLSAAQLHRLVRRHFRSGPKRLLDSRILLEAKRLLDHSEKSVAQIGAELGFHDPAYFSRFFRRWAGQAPGAYRQRGKVPDCASN